MPRIVYQQHTAKLKVKTFCKVCNKKLNRIISEWFSMSEFNPYSYEENILRRSVKLNKMQEEMINNGVVCRGCE